MRRPEATPHSATPKPPPLPPLPPQALEQHQEPNPPRQKKKQRGPPFASAAPAAGPAAAVGPTDLAATFTIADSVRVTALSSAAFTFTAPPHTCGEKQRLQRPFRAVSGAQVHFLKPCLCAPVHSNHAAAFAVAPTVAFAVVNLFDFVFVVYSQPAEP